MLPGTEEVPRSVAYIFSGLVSLYFTLNIFGGLWLSGRALASGAGGPEFQPWPPPGHG